ncbi:hypothetical protein [Neisseria montereyensis]|uniref:DUF8095 domain-containing protein n=1 Tax=Neisseria montereyensis TaxID=2973938 RepID=A0ABT2FCN7_9NEIS|nr:hypothetical protein [Neisseria montereyensis]MCS4533903.1 hypothetical protein [Neisseria montereyensis]
MLRKFVFGLGLLALASCSSMSGNTGKDKMTWLIYKDIDKSMQAISFERKPSANNGQTDPLYNSHGTALKRNGTDNDYSTLGDLYYLVDNDGTKMSALFLLGNESLNPRNKEDMRKLAQSKQFDFYEFGKGRTAHAQYSAKDNICKSFRSRQGVNVEMATSYYVGDNYANFYTSFISGNISRRDVKVNNYTHSFSNRETQEGLKETAEKYGRNLARRNLIEKATLLINVVCQ